MTTLVSGGADPRRPDAYLDNELATAVYSGLGAAMLSDEALCVEVWESLTNTVWTGRGGSWLYSFRSAGDLIASIVDRGDYLDWYCCGTPGRVSGRVERALSRRGFEHAAA